MKLANKQAANLSCKTDDERKALATGDSRLHRSAVRAASPSGRKSSSLLSSAIRLFTTRKLVPKTCEVSDAAHAPEQRKCACMAASSFRASGLLYMQQIIIDCLLFNAGGSIHFEGEAASRGSWARIGNTISISAMF